MGHISACSELDLKEGREKFCYCKDNFCNRNYDKIPSACSIPEVPVTTPAQGKINNLINIIKIIFSISLKKKQK